MFDFILRGFQDRDRNKRTSADEPFPFFFFNLFIESFKNKNRNEYELKQSIKEKRKKWGKHERIKKRCSRKKEKRYKEITSNFL